MRGMPSAHKNKLSLITLLLTTGDGVHILHIWNWHKSLYWSDFLANILTHSATNKHTYIHTNTYTHTHIQTNIHTTLYTLHIKYTHTLKNTLIKMYFFYFLLFTSTFFNLNRWDNPIIPVYMSGNDFTYRDCEYPAGYHNSQLCYPKRLFVFMLDECVPGHTAWNVNFARTFGALGISSLKTKQVPTMHPFSQVYVIICRNENTIEVNNFSKTLSSLL